MASHPRNCKTKGGSEKRTPSVEEKAESDSQKTSKESTSQKLVQSWNEWVAVKDFPPCKVDKHSTPGEAFWNT